MEQLPILSNKSEILEDASVQRQRALLLAAILVVMASGCGTTAISSEETPVSCEDNSAETLLMQYDWLRTIDFEAACILRSEIWLNECRVRRDSEECSEQYDATTISCMNAFANGLNVAPLRACGEPIYIIERDPVTGEITNRYINSGDFDGDGLSAWDEYRMGLNPCTVYSFPIVEGEGGCVSDGELDFDNDGVRNSDDEDPRCYGDYGVGDPASGQSDCI